MATEEKKKKTCFVIMPISDVNGYDPGHFTRVYEHLIKPACEQAGFKPERADETPRTDVIMAGILKKIIDCDIAICDLSSRNANVFYELGLRHAFNKKTVLIRDSRTDAPFDISVIRILEYNESLRIDEVEKVIPEIATYLTETDKADKTEANSMLQMLSIEDSATLPQKSALGAESRMILNAIEQMNQKLSTIMDEWDITRMNEQYYTWYPVYENKYISHIKEMYEQQYKLNQPLTKINKGK